MFSFDRLRQRIMFKCVPHEQHDYFSSCNQSDHCFLASSLHKLSVVIKKCAAVRHFSDYISFPFRAKRTASNSHIRCSDHDINM